MNCRHLNIASYKIKLLQTLVLPSEGGGPRTSLQLYVSVVDCAEELMVPEGIRFLLVTLTTARPPVPP
jgi:hypothetical protein